ncbi:hypothetical protein [Rhodococcus chondri]|uniref:Uncharacterized protein n=1 Tax=Rhodococcus chondri TaxID=3065941 RepID=A0ABU7JRQ2_9NOCA|nr:hypothetical protein [Rhodococcus sp. CC-R104]MEE2032689.1 hypothetical protein [Rhodococcus sp. CC-R104]
MAGTPREFSVGTAVVVRSTTSGKTPVPGKIVQDFGSAQQAVGDNLGRDWAPVRRWAVELDDGRLVFVDDDALELRQAK